MQPQHTLSSKCLNWKLRGGWLGRTAGLCLGKLLPPGVLAKPHDRCLGAGLQAFLTAMCLLWSLVTVPCSFFVELEVRWQVVTKEVVLFG